MRIQIPYFKYRTSVPSCKHHGRIEMEGEVIHKINDMQEFHKAFGYTPDMAKEGRLPDEFIWEEYVKDMPANCSACFQMRLIDYLIKHSIKFMEKYGDQCEGWIAAYAKARAESEVCRSCKRSALQEMNSDSGNDIGISFMKVVLP